MLRRYRVFRYDMVRDVWVELPGRVEARRGADAIREVLGGGLLPTQSGEYMAVAEDLATRATLELDLRFHHGPGE